MPEENYWNSLFDIQRIVSWLDLRILSSSVVEIGCGYGTFSIPISKNITVPLHAYDIEPDMIERAKNHALHAGIENIEFILRDVIEQGTGLSDESVGLVVLFNILHFPEKRVLLQEASRILKPNGHCAIIHWRKDIPTPRGPAFDTRPDKNGILDACKGTNLKFESSTVLEPYHWGLKLIKGVMQ
jgi:ubiquinone/menaquinone biosynthesis C-methylase UbiE